MALRRDPAFILRWFVLIGAVVIGGGLPACSGSGGTASVVNPTPIPTPTPVPTPSPTPSPTPVPSNPVASPNPLTFTNAGAAYNQTFTVTEANYTGPLNAANGAPSCSGIATFSPASATSTPATFTVTPVAAGTCKIVVTDSGGRSTSVTVTVTITPVTVT